MLALQADLLFSATGSKVFKTSLSWGTLVAGDKQPYQSGGKST